MSTILYNPDRKSKEYLISEFVVRTQVYKEIMNDLESSKMEFPEQHYLLVGQRGAGKTTLLNRLKYGIQDSEKLKNVLIPVNFNEEQYDICELANLWESTGKFLEDYQGFDGLYSEIENNLGKQNFEEISFDILEKYLRKYKKRLVLLIDNIGDLLKKLDKTEIHRLREILQTKKEIRLIAGSPFYLETILDYHQPLFEFFKVIRLEDLDEKDTQRLLIKLGELNNEKDKIERVINETPERVETLRVLTGGVPRTIALMYQIFIDYNDENTIRDLERILDAVTPLYKHRMDDLPIQQQKIVDAVARNWDAISVKELKSKIRIDSKNISAQLRQLEKNQIIEKKETGKKNHLYFLKERFFNIWYLMRYGRKDDKQRVVWLVKFLEGWCSSADIQARILNYISKVNKGLLDGNSIKFYGTVYSAFSNIDLEVKLLLKRTIPIDISKNVIIADYELEQTILNYEKSENWEKVLELSVDLNSATFELQKTIYFALAQISDVSRTSFYKKMIERFELLLKDDLNNESQITLPFGEYQLIKFLIFRNLVLCIITEELDKWEYEFDRSLKFLVKTEFHEKSFDYVLLANIMCFALAKEHYNLLYKIFNNNINNTISLTEVFKPIYYTLLYLKDGKDSSELLKAGPEIQNLIKDVLENVYEYKIQFKN